MRVRISTTMGGPCPKEEGFGGHKTPYEAGPIWHLMDPLHAHILQNEFRIRCLERYIQELADHLNSEVADDYLTTFEWQLPLSEGKVREIQREVGDEMKDDYPGAEDLVEGLLG